MSSASSAPPPVRSLTCVQPTSARRRRVVPRASRVAVSAGPAHVHEFAHADHAQARDGARPLPRTRRDHRGRDEWQLVSVESFASEMLLTIALG